MWTYLEEEADDKDLQRAHGDDEGDLDHTETDNALLGALDGCEVSVLTCAEVFLVSGDGREVTRDFEDGLLDGGCLLRGCALLGGKLCL